jgi:hypothetical protein
VDSYVNEKVEKRALMDYARGRRVALVGRGNSNLVDGSMRKNRSALRDLNHARRAERT